MKGDVKIMPIVYIAGTGIILYFLRDIVKGVSLTVKENIPKGRRFRIVAEVLEVIRTPELTIWQNEVLTRLKKGTQVQILYLGRTTNHILGQDYHYVNVRYQVKQGTKWIMRSLNGWVATNQVQEIVN